MWSFIFLLHSLQTTCVIRYFLQNLPFLFLFLDVNSSWEQPISHCGAKYTFFFNLQMFSFFNLKIWKNILNTRRCWLIQQQQPVSCVTSCQIRLDSRISLGSPSTLHYLIRYLEPSVSTIQLPTLKWLLLIKWPSIYMTDSPQYPWTLNLINNVEDNVVFSSLKKDLILIISPLFMKQFLHCL